MIDKPNVIALEISARDPRSEMLRDESRSKRLLADVQLILWPVGGLVMGVSMGLAGVGGMLRRMLYVNGLGPFQSFMNAAPCIFDGPRALVSTAN